MVLHVTEVKLASIMLGVLAIGWSLVMLWPSGAFLVLFEPVNDGFQNVIAWALLLHGVASIAGSVAPLRRVRQYSLALGAITWFALFGVLLQLWILSPLMLGAIGVGVLTGLTLWCDVAGKPRDEPRRVA